MSAAILPISTGSITRWHSLTDPVGKRDRRPWSALFQELSAPRRFAGGDHPGWSAAVFEGDQRAKGRVIHVTAAVLDYDGTEFWVRAAERWGQFFGFMHASKSHTEDEHRFRVVLPLSRAVTAEEWDAMWLRLNEHADGKLDGQAKDASRFWYMPGTLDGSPHRTQELTGTMLDPDEWLKRPLRAAQVARRAEYERRDQTPDEIERRAVAYIAKMPEAVSGSGGHGATWAVALVLARGFGLSADTTFRILRDEYNHRCAPPWTERELSHKADSAAQAGLPLGYLLDSGREWRPSSEPMPEEPRDPVEDLERAAIAGEPGTVAPAPKAEPPKGLRSMADILAAVLERAKAGRSTMGIKTGHFRLDHLLGGFRPQRVTVLGARTSFGKSSYAIMVADEAIRVGRRVLLISAEDSEDTFGQRFMSRRARVNAFRLRVNNCNKDDLTRMTEQATAAERTPFFLEAIGHTAESIAAAIRSMQPAPELVIVDYLQRISASKRTQDKRTEVTFVTSVIADAIKSVGAAGLMLSQLRRLDGAPNKEPSMFDLKESGDIENMAEHILIGWCEDEGGGDVSPLSRKRFLKVEKNKDGPVDTRPIELPFDDATASFRLTDGECFDDGADPGADFWDN